MSSLQSNPTGPKVFIGYSSSQEGLEVATLIQQSLRDKVQPFLWIDPGVFFVGQVIIDELMQIVDRFDFAIFVMSPDDETVKHGVKYKTPRDNLIFEMGLFTGRYGRGHAFMVTSSEGKTELPGDLGGVIFSAYKKVSIEGKPSFDVQDATERIMLAINKAVEERASISSTKFWSTLSDSVVIIYGVEYTECAKRPRISLRDLDTAIDILHFLSRWYPKKHVIPIRAGTPGWEHALRPQTDIIIVGGPVTNKEFADRQPDYERRYHLRMGRLCEVEGQRVYHVTLGEGSGRPIPPRSDPQAIDDFPSEHVRRDYGLVTSRRVAVYGHSRRVITITGIKGNGTRGAASVLLGDPRQPVKLDDILPPLTADDSVELVVATDVANGIIHRSEIIERALNDKREYLPEKQYWEPCELEQPCECCAYNLHAPAQPVNS